MKHFINILIILLLFASAVGIAYMERTSTSDKSGWGMLYIPLILLMTLWGIKLKNDYE